MFARPRPVPFIISLLTHGALLAWVASGPVYELEPKSLYTQAIAPHASKLIWYSFREKLPEVSPAEPRKSPLPPRAEFKAPQEIVAGSKDAPHARQFIWQPVPKIQLKQDLEAPNVVAVHIPKPEPPVQPKLFVPPQPPKSAPVAREITAPPQLQGAAVPIKPVLELAVPRLPPKRFVPPPLRHVPRAPAALDAPPELLMTHNLSTAGAVGNALGARPANATPRTFIAPRLGQGGRGGIPAIPALPDAPVLSGVAAGTNSPVSLAIVGLNPSAASAMPMPPGSRDAQFSAGPQPRATGGEGGSGHGAGLTVPGLLIRGAPDSANGTAAKPLMLARASAPTSASNLSAALRTSLPGSVTPAPPPPAMHVSADPEGTFDGRTIYEMSVQMPNITSYTGSWMIWFAERSDTPGPTLHPPVPLRKVDPKYYVSAIADRVEGKVRLAAIIRADGHVDSVTVLHHLDDRLDRSAEEALAKWIFTPAERQGHPVEVDAVIEIPFRLAPQVAP